MKKTQCFVIQRGTDFDKAVKEHFQLDRKWEKVFPKVSDLLEETITRMMLHPERLLIDLDEIKNEETKKLFKKDGELKANSNKAKEVLEQYKEIIKEEGLTEYRELRTINFMHRVIRFRGENLESFRTQEDDIYYKTDFDLEERSNGNVIPISEIEYEETYLNELKRREANKKESST